MSNNPYFKVRLYKLIEPCHIGPFEALLTKWYLTDPGNQGYATNPDSGRSHFSFPITNTRSLQHPRDRADPEPDERPTNGPRRLITGETYEEEEDQSFPTFPIGEQQQLGGGTRSTRGMDDNQLGRREGDRGSVEETSGEIHGGNETPIIQEDKGEERSMVEEEQPEAERDENAMEDIQS